MSMRNRVLEFEKEMATELNNLQLLEREISDVSKLRQVWLESVSKVDDCEMETVTKKVELLKLKADLCLTDLLIDGVKLEGFYEAQHLKHLVIATGPCAPGETREARRLLLTRLAREDAEQLNRNLVNSLDYRNKIGYVCDSLTRELKSTVNLYKERQVTTVNDLRKRIMNYIERLRAAHESSRGHYKSITADYLVLRHNARIAKEVLVRKQNECIVHREELQNHMDKLVEEANNQRLNLEESAREELRALTADIRGELMKNEASLRIATVAAQEKKRKDNVSDNSLRKSIKIVEDKCEKLEETRKEEVVRVQQEISTLRDLMQKVELKYAQAKVAKIRVGGSIV